MLKASEPVSAAICLAPQLASLLCLCGLPSRSQPFHPASSPPQLLQLWGHTSHFQA